MAKKTRTELSTLALNTNLPDNTTELITPTTERSQLTDERESVVNYKDDLGGTGNAGKFLTVATDGESLTMVDEPSGVPAWVTFVTTALANIMKLAAAGTTGNTQYSQINFLDSAATDILARIVSVQSSSATAGLNTLTIQTGTTDGTEGPSIFLSGEYYRNMILSSKNNTISLDTGGEFKVQINSVPQLTIGSTGLATFANGIKFGTGDTLNDYEEGIWTPTMNTSQGNLGTFTSSGTYTRIGRLVSLQITYTMTATGSPTPSAGITLVQNIPFSKIGNESFLTGYGAQPTSGKSINAFNYPSGSVSIGFYLSDGNFAASLNTTSIVTVQYLTP